MAGTTAPAIGMRAYGTAAAHLLAPTLTALLLASLPRVSASSPLVVLDNTLGLNLSAATYCNGIQASGWPGHSEWYAAGPAFAFSSATNGFPIAITGMYLPINYRAATIDPSAGLDFELWLHTVSGPSGEADAWTVDHPQIASRKFKAIIPAVVDNNASAPGSGLPTHISSYVYADIKNAPPGQGDTGKNFSIASPLTQYAVFLRLVAGGYELGWHVADAAVPFSSQAGTLIMGPQLNFVRTSTSGSGWYTSSLTSAVMMLTDDAGSGGGAGNASVTATPTAAPSPSPNATANVTATATASTSVVPSANATSSVTASAQPSANATGNSTATATATSSGSYIATATATRSAFASWTRTPSSTPSNTSGSPADRNPSNKGADPAVAAGVTTSILFIACCAGGFCCLTRTASGINVQRKILAAHTTFRSADPIMTGVVVTSSSSAAAAPPTVVYSPAAGLSVMGGPAGSSAGMPVAMAGYPGSTVPPPQQQQLPQPLYFYPQVHQQAQPSMVLMSAPAPVAL